MIFNFANQTLNVDSNESSMLYVSLALLVTVILAFVIEWLMGTKNNKTDALNFILQYVNINEVKNYMNLLSHKALNDLYAKSGNLDNYISKTIHQIGLELFEKSKQSNCKLLQKIKYEQIADILENSIRNILKITIEDCYQYMNKLIDSDKASAATHVPLPEKK